MAKVDFRRIRQDEFAQLHGLLQNTLLTMKRRQNFAELMDDLLTQSEVVMLGRRIRIAQWLLYGKSCEVVSRKLHAGLATVYTVDRWLRIQCSSYEKIFPSLYWEMMHKAAKDRKKYSYPYSWNWIRSKYPMHFLLINLLLDDMEARKMLEE